MVNKTDIPVLKVTGYINPFKVDQAITGCPRISGEHKIHPYFHPEILCRGESCIRPNRIPAAFFVFSDRLIWIDHRVTGATRGR